MFVEGGGVCIIEWMGLLIICGYECFFDFGL